MPSIPEAGTLLVERPARGTVVIRVSGAVNRVTLTRLRALVDRQIALGRAHAGARVREVVVELPGESDLPEGALDEVQRRTDRAGVLLRFTGRPALVPTV